ncbi:UPF0481 protein At3g47200-like [Abrus precatorius]|uniref:UPF0481 protein At3g47200-like n=1 Tax=Abrus precatorius TaxID=3816 RepID=A0A8B8LPY4_ABRPR|nr:UPF0481 protein At3g47200-like [Abrus precatorius]
MEEQPNASQSECQQWGKELTDMLQGVVLPEKSGVHGQCIFRVPDSIRETNPKAYTPRVVSIGPFHKARSNADDNVLKAMEEFKLKYLKGFLDRTKLRVDDFACYLKDQENRIRSCYAWPVEPHSNHFLKMILIDACFIIEHFLRDFEDNDWIYKDPLLLKPWLVDDVYDDLTLLENQLPFFVLEGIYEIAQLNLQFPSFLDITFEYFQEYNEQNITSERVRPKHFTDLLRTFFLPSTFDLGDTPAKRDELKYLYSASQLSEAGLAFKVNPSKCLLDLDYHDGELTIPCLTVHDETEKLFRNIVAFEQCLFPNTPLVTQYLKVLDYLIDTEKDVNLLVDKKIIVNYMGDTKAVATMVNSLSTNVAMPHFNSKYFSICISLNKFYENPRNKYKAIFIHEYFNTPWKIASTVAASMLLLLTLIQTVCSAIPLFKG